MFRNRCADRLISDGSRRRIHNHCVVFPRLSFVPAYVIDDARAPFNSGARLETACIVSTLSLCSRKQVYSCGHVHRVRTSPIQIIQIKLKIKNISIFFEWGKRKYTFFRLFRALDEFFAVDFDGCACYCFAAFFDYLMDFCTFRFFHS